MRHLIILTAAAIPYASEARADALQQQVLAGARAVPSDGYSFRRSLTIERTGAARKLLVERFDPRLPVASRWYLIAVDGRAPTVKEIEQSRKARRGDVPSYHQLARWFGAPATRVDAAPGYATYRFARLPKGVLKVGPVDPSEHLSVEASVNLKGSTPFVERVRITSTKPFRIMMVASVKSMTITGRYRLGPDGRPVPADNASDFAGSVFGKARTMRTRTTFDEMRAVR